MIERAIYGAVIAISIALAIGVLVLFTVILVQAGLSWFIITGAVVAALGAGVAVFLDGWIGYNDSDD